MSTRRKAIVAAVVVVYLASNAALGWFIAQELNTQSRVTRIEHTLRIEHVGGKRHAHHKRGRVSHAAHTHHAGGGSHRSRGASGTAGRTQPHGTPSQRNPSSPVATRHPSGFTGPGHTSHSHGHGHGGGTPHHAPKPVATVTVPSQHVGPITTPSVTVTVPPLPRILRHLPHIPGSE